MTRPKTHSVRLSSHPSVPSDVALRIGDILEEEQVARSLPEAPEYRFRIEAVIPADLSLAAAHAVWQPGHLSTLAGLAPFAAQDARTITPSGLVRVSCECVRGASGGMSSYHGFQGHFVSLLVSIPEARVWDARVEKAE